MLVSGRSTITQASPQVNGGAVGSGGLPRATTETLGAYMGSGQRPEAGAALSFGQGDTKLPPGPPEGLPWASGETVISETLIYAQEADGDGRPGVGGGRNPGGGGRRAPLISQEAPGEALVKSFSSTDVLLSFPQLQPGSAAPLYKDYVDTSSKMDFDWPKTDADRLEGRPWPGCAKWVLPGQCENGHRFARVLLCGQEWCLECGRDWSWIHQRRFARWLPKAMQIKNMGYWVIEWPLASRCKLRSKLPLSDMGKRVKGAFQALGYARGLRRWHFFGDYAGLIGGVEVGLDELRIPYLKAFNSLIKAFAEMDGFDLVLNANQGTIFWSRPGGKCARVVARLVADFAKTYGLHLKPYSSIKLNAHENVLVDGRYLSKSKLKSEKAFLRQVLGEPQLIVNYHYRKSVAEKVHTLKYVTRATFLDKEWDKEMADKLFNFQNANYWGKWADPPVWELRQGEGELGAVESLESGICPDCGEPIHWSRPVEIAFLKTQGPVGDLGAGYFRLPDLPGPRSEPVKEPARVNPLEITGLVIRARAHSSRKARALASRWWADLD